LDFVHEVSENLGGFGRNFERGPGQWGIEKDARGAEFDAFAIRELKQLRLGVGELPMSREGRLRLERVPCTDLFQWRGPAGAIPCPSTSTVTVGAVRSGSTSTGIRIAT
jgi:hypothetical protein